MPFEYRRGMKDAFTARNAPIDYGVLEDAVKKTKERGPAFDYGVGYIVGMLITRKAQIIDDAELYDAIHLALEGISSRIPPSVRETILGSIHRLKENTSESEKLQSLESAISEK